MRRSIVAVSAGVAALLFVVLGGAAEESNAPEPKREAGEAAGSVDAAPLPVYVPPPRGAARRRIGGASRGSGQRPTLLALAPDHVGRTSEAGPVLHWWLSEPVADRVELTVIEEGAVDPLLEAKLGEKLAPGVHAVLLAERGVELEVGKVYSWFVTIIPDDARRSSDVLAGAWIERVARSPELERALGAAPPERAFEVYAQQGLWYDALAALDRTPAPEAERARAALLEQVDLGEVAGR